MRLNVLSAWTSLAGLGVVLTVAAGCQLPVPEENGDGAQNQDPNKFDPSKTDPNGNPITTPMPGPGNNYVPGNSIPVARKLALDLSGVAGFAIMDDADQDNTDAPTPPGGISGAAAGGIGSALWLESSTAGQLLVRNADRFASPADRIGANLSDRISGVSQQDPGTDLPPTSGGGSATAPAAAAPGAAPAPEENVGEQAGLLKITAEGEIVPALVAVEDPTAVANAGAPPTDGAGGAGGAGGAPSGNTGSAGATPTGTGTGAGDAAPPPTGVPPAAGSGGASTGTATAPQMGPIGPQPQAEPLPRVTALGLSPDGSVYVLFQHGFIYRQPTAEEAATPGFDPFSQQSPYRCQLFRADGSWRSAAPGGHDLAQLECVTNEYEVPTWDVRKVMQFDAAGNLYFRAVRAQNPQGVFVKFDPTSKQLSEKVNANICWRDVQVTPRGSLFYTGSTGTNGDCGGTSFFRYVSTDNRLTEIARDWWNFKYLAEQDPEDPNNERIIFYGPDPNSNSGGSYSWDSACLYRYNPAAPVLADRTEKLVDCYRDGWSYVNGVQGMGPQMPSTPSDADLPAFRERCESEGQLFIGGDGVTALSQLEDGTLFVVGRFQRKLAGELGCGLDLTVDHCALLGNGGPSDALDAASTTEQACTDAGHTWVHMAAGCSNPSYETPDLCMSNSAQWNPGGGFRHYEMTGTACAAVGEGVTRNHLDCRMAGQMGGSFSQEVTGLGYLVSATEDVPSHIELLSDPAERVERYWPVPGADGAQLFYSTYNAGQYSLRMAVQVPGEGGGVEIQRRSLLNDYEVYNLQRDPAHPQRVMFDALQFSTNSYLFGSIDPTLATPEEIQASLEVVAGVSGKVETLIVLPSF